MSKDILRQSGLWNEQNNTFHMWTNKNVDGYTVPVFVEVPEWYFEKWVYPVIIPY